MKRLLILLLLISLVGAAACKKSTSVGTKKLTNIKEQQQKQRLGEFLKSPEPSGGAGGSPAALGAPSPTAKVANSPPPQQQTKTLDVALIDDSPFYDSTEPSCAKGVERCRLSLPVGSILRLVNKDDNPRRYASADQTYDTGDLSPGASKQLALNSKGEFTIEDPNVPFAAADLQVF
jgi:hypothetical protein